MSLGGREGEGWDGTETAWLRGLTPLRTYLIFYDIMYDYVFFITVQTLMTALTYSPV